MEWLLPLLGGLGIGSVATTVTGHLLNRRLSLRDLKYREKREAYLGLLDALHKAAVSPSDANAKAFALWQTRVSLFGSEEVAQATQGIVDTNEGPVEKRNEYFRSLLAAMKKDLWAEF